MFSFYSSYSTLKDQYKLNIVNMYMHIVLIPCSLSIFNNLDKKKGGGDTPAPPVNPPPAYTDIFLPDWYHSIHLSFLILILIPILASRSFSAPSFLILLFFYRLVPEHYNLTINTVINTANISGSHFTGSVGITLSIAKSTNFVVFHSRDLELSDISLKPVGGTQVVTSYFYSLLY